MSIDQGRWQRHRWFNRLQTLLLLLGMTGFLALLGYLLWGRDGLWALLLTALLLLFMRPLISPAWVMRVYGARLLAPADAPDLYRLIGQLSARAGLVRLPSLYFLPNPVVNAFTVGNRRRATIALSEGLLRYLGPRELAGVLAHEISHIRNNDIQVMQLADFIGRMTAVLSLLGLSLLMINLPLLLFAEESLPLLPLLLLMVAPHLSLLAQLGLSRTREFDADLSAASLTDDPEGLALALLRIEQLQEGGWARMLFPGRRLPLPRLLRSHPDNAERARRLLALRGSERDDGLVWRHYRLPPGQARPGHISRWWF
ncbi:MAG: zinc metalloprotease HtpX [Thiohalomonadaceae bacterium]